MSEMNSVRSNGTLQLINGKKFRGYLQADQEGAAFYAKGQTEPVAQWHYARMNRMDNIRRGAPPARSPSSSRMIPATSWSWPRA